MKHLFCVTLFKIVELKMFKLCFQTLSKFSKYSACKIPFTSSVVGNNIASTAYLNAKVIEKITVTFKMHDGTKVPVKAKVGDSLLDVVVEHDVDIDGFGACEGTLACSTCHLILHKEDFDKYACRPSDEELDMLDLAYDLQDTSRLGCQIVLTKDMDGLEVMVPKGTMDARDV